MMDAWLNNLAIFFLVFARVAGVFSVAPVFGTAPAPPQIRLMLAVGLSIAIAPVAGVPLLAASAGPLEVAAALMREAAIGLTIGYITLVIMSVAQVAGHFIDWQIGFGMSQAIDPMTNTQMPVISRFLQYFVLLLFLTTGAHHFLIRALADSFTLIGPGGAADLAAAKTGILTLTVNLFVTALKISGPILGLLLLSDIALGLVGRTMPQMNLLMVGFPLKIGLGIAAFSAALPVIILVLTALLSSLYGDIMGILKMMVR